MPRRAAVPLWLALAAALAALTAAVDGKAGLAWEQDPARWLHDHHHFFPLSDQFWEVMGHLGRAPIVAAIIVVLAVLLALRGAFSAAVFSLATLAGALSYYALRWSVDRPYDAAAATDPGRTYPLADSFPSGHAFGEFLAFGLLFAFAGRLAENGWAVTAIRAACIALIMFGGLERLVDGRHWPTDVLGAWLLAALHVLPAAWLAAGAIRRPAVHRA